MISHPYVIHHLTLMAYTILLLCHTLSYCYVIHYLTLVILSHLHATNYLSSCHKISYPHDIHNLTLISYTVPLVSGLLSWWKCNYRVPAVRTDSVAAPAHPLRDHRGARRGRGRTGRRHRMYLQMSDQP